MSDPVTQLQFYDAMRTLEASMQAKHSSMRETVTDHFERLSMRVTAHEEEDRQVEKRLAKIEVQREEETKQTVKRGTYAGIIGAFGLTTIWEIMKAKWNL